MSFFHHGTTRKYTSALLDFFSEIEVQYILSNDTIKNKKVPIRYSSVEKSTMLDGVDQEQILSGNYNFLPRANLALSGMVKNDERSQNRASKIGTFRTENSIEYMHNSVPYDFSFSLTYQCRGMNEATQIIEQIAAKFNPYVHIDIWDANNLSTPTRVPIKLENINIENEDYDLLSTNIVTVSFELTVVGSLYQPMQSIERIKEFKIYYNSIIDDVTAKREEMQHWDVDLEGYIIPVDDYSIRKFDITITNDYTENSLDRITFNIKFENKPLNFKLEDIGVFGIVSIFDFQRIDSKNYTLEVLLPKNTASNVTLEIEDSKVLDINEHGNRAAADSVNFDNRVLLESITNNAGLLTDEPVVFEIILGKTPLEFDLTYLQISNPETALVDFLQISELKYLVTANLPINKTGSTTLSIPNTRTLDDIEITSTANFDTIVRFAERYLSHKFVDILNTDYSQSVKMQGDVDTTNGDFYVESVTKLINDDSVNEAGIRQNINYSMDNVFKITSKELKIYATLNDESNSIRCSDSIEYNMDNLFTVKSKDVKVYTSIGENVSIISNGNINTNITNNIKMFSKEVKAYAQADEQMNSIRNTGSVETKEMYFYVKSYE